MSTPTTEAKVPRRDEQGRMVNLPQVLGVAVLFTLTNAVALVSIDGLLALLGLSSFGRSSGWLVLILPAFLYFDDFRAWRPYGVRYLAALVGVFVALALALLAAGLVGGAPPLVSGAVGALVAVLVYAPVWFAGVRLLSAQRTEPK
jgi:hypothetical protein